MAFPTRLQVKQLFLQVCDDPAASVFTDVANPSTGAVSVFQAGFSQAYDILFNNALNQQIPLVEKVVQGIIIPPSPIPFGVTPAQIGLFDFGDVEWVSERAAGSTDQFKDLIDTDRLPQQQPTDRLIYFVYQNGMLNFIGCTTPRELQLKYVFSSAGAPTDDTVAVAFDNCLNFLTNYAAGCVLRNKGYDEMGARALSFAVGPKFDLGQIGGELFRLMQPLVRSRQNVKVAPKPYSSRPWRRGYAGYGSGYVQSQFGTTGGGGSQNVPLQFSSSNFGATTIVGSIDGSNLIFFFPIPVYPSYGIFRNGVYQTSGVDYIPFGANQFTFLAGSVPQPGDIISGEAYPVY